MRLMEMEMKIGVDQGVGGGITPNRPRKLVGH
jgi:hypothetical protein